MVFFFNLLFSIVFAYVLDRWMKNHNVADNAIALLFFPLFLLWILICGGQYAVGTDYYSYLDIFNNINGFAEHYCSKGEFGFVGIIQVCKFFGFKGQSLFYVFYGIGFLFFYLLLKRIKGNIFIFILLYITVTSLFNNQLNILRQSVAIYIGTYASLLIIEHKKLKGFLYILFAMSIHISSAIFLLVYLHGFVALIKPLWLFVFIVICLIVGTLLTPSMMNIYIPYLPDSYAWHIISGLSTHTLLQRITKYIFIPIYLLAISSYRRYKMTPLNKTLFHFGALSFSLRLLLINIGVVSRLFDSFLLFSIFPLHTYMGYLFANKKYTFLFISISSALLLFYFLKTIVFPVGEYLYQSIYM